MRAKYKLLLIACGVVALGALFRWLVAGKNIAIWQPAGEVAMRQKELIVFALLLSLVVVIPVFVLTIGIVWRYRETNHKARYSPEWDSNKALEFVWWGIPALLITILSVITWQTSHSLDPFKPLSSTVKPLEIQVVALQWKWLFIYPDEQIATINFIKVPVDTPLNFKITADAPMNSFWIPKLGSQIYAMNGMVTQVNLMANQTGAFPGYSANISGEGFADMRFMVNAVTADEYGDWVSEVKTSNSIFDHREYVSLTDLGRSEPTVYSEADTELFDHILSQFKTIGRAHSHDEY